MSVMLCAQAACRAPTVLKVPQHAVPTHSQAKAARPGIAIAFSFWLEH